MFQVIGPAKDDGVFKEQQRGLSAAAERLKWKQ